jgi:hypothetical protein
MIAAGKLAGKQDGAAGMVVRQPQPRQAIPVA